MDSRGLSLMTALSVFGASAAFAQTDNFDKDPPGAVPPQFPATFQNPVLLFHVKGAALAAAMGSPSRRASAARKAGVSAPRADIIKGDFFMGKGRAESRGTSHDCCKSLMGKKLYPRPGSQSSRPTAGTAGRPAASPHHWQNGGRRRAGSRRPISGAMRARAAAPCFDRAISKRASSYPHYSAG